MPELTPELSEFRPEDLPQLISLLNDAEKNLRDFRPYTDEEFNLLILQDEAFDPKGLILARLQGGLMGAAFAYADPEYVRFQNQKRGFLRWIRVRPEYASTELRSKLLDASLAFLSQRGMEDLQVSVPSHNQSDLDFYGDNGFRLVRRFNYLEKPLSNDLPDPILPSHFTWTQFSPGEEEEWVACINSAFRDHWGKRPMSEGEFSRWTQDPAFDPTGIMGIRKAEALVGVIYCEIDYSYIQHTGRHRSMLWVIGVIPSEQGRGLGRALTVAGMNWSKAKGMKIAALFVDSENARALSLYNELGFEQAYETHHLVRRLD